MAFRQTSKSSAKSPRGDEPAANPSGQGKRPEAGQFQLQVDRQTKLFYGTYEPPNEPRWRSSKATRPCKYRYTTLGKGLGRSLNYRMLDRMCSASAAIALSQIINNG
jgi:hypothetical protein